MISRVMSTVTERQVTERQKGLQDPQMPSKLEVQEHELTHLPFRNWCRHCVRGRGKEFPHRRVGDDASMPELHADMCLLGDENDPGNTVPVLVVRERSSRMTMAVPSKTTNTYISKRVVAFMKEVSVVHGDVLVRSDQEPAMKAILSEVGARSCGRRRRKVRDGAVPCRVQRQ